MTQLGYKLNIFHLWHDFFKFATNKIFNDIKKVFGNIIEYLLNNIISI